MLNSDLLGLNNILGEVKIPEDINTDDLFNFLSAKGELEEIVGELGKKIELFKKETKPNGDAEVPEGSEDFKNWNRKFNELYIKLLQEENDVFKPKEISKDLFTRIAKGMKVNEVMLLKKGFVL